MVFYAEFVPDSHVVVVVDEEYEEPGEIPEDFLQIEHNHQPDWFPTRSTTIGPEIQISVVQNVNGTEQSSVTSSPHVATSKVTTDRSAWTTIAPNMSIVSPEKVLDMQFFSDVDGANK